MSFLHQITSWYDSFINTTEGCIPDRMNKDSQMNSLRVCNRMECGDEMGGDRSHNPIFPEIGFLHNEKALQLSLEGFSNMKNDPGNYLSPTQLPTQYLRRNRA